MSRIEESIIVEAPAEAAYGYWSRFESFPAFMEGVEQVTEIGENRYRWEAEIAGARREWIAEVTQMIPPSRIAWTTTAGETEHQGAVHFTPLDDNRCEVKVQMVVNPQGFLETLGDTLGFVTRRVQGDLERFKLAVENQSVMGESR